MISISRIRPTKIYINGRFFCTADNVIIDDYEIKIERRERTKEELEALEREKNSGSYDEFFNKMVQADTDPKVRTPVDTTGI